MSSESSKIIFDGLKAAFLSISSEVWSAVISGVFVAAVSIITIRKQLRHAENHSKKERELATKKQVYFDACDTLAQMQSVLASILKIDLNASADFSNISSAITKLNIVADIKLIKKFHVCQTYFGKAIIELIAERMIVDAMSSNAKHALDIHNMHLKHFSDLTNLYKNASGHEELDGIRREQAALSDRMAYCLEFHENATNEELTKKIEIARKSMVCSAEFSVLASECIVDMRYELENAFSEQDEKTYKVLVKDSAQETRRILNEFLDDINSKRKIFDPPDL